MFLFKSGAYYLQPFSNTTNNNMAVTNGRWQWYSYLLGNDTIKPDELDTPANNSNTVSIFQFNDFPPFNDLTNRASDRLGIN